MMTTPPTAFHCLMNALRQPAIYPHPVTTVQLIETHISVVLLAGDYAYKLKKPVALGFLDFSTLAQRRYYCEEELRLNRRLAAQLYCGMVTIRGTVTAPQWDGDGPLLEYAIKMHRFDQSALLTQHKLTRPLIAQLAQRLAHFHCQLPPAPLTSEWGTPAQIITPVLETIAHIRQDCSTPAIHTQVARLATWIQHCYQQLLPLFAHRRASGAIRECHGDMHRGNIVVINQQPLIFDALEFNPALRWIDCMSELAFLIMDIRYSGRIRLSRCLMNDYLEITGDYAGVPLLRFYLVYRALVRAKVAALRYQQTTIDNTRAQTHIEIQRYVQLARQCVRKTRPRLFITHGVSGSGKTWLGRHLSERMELIHLRSDVERKRLCGLIPAMRPHATQLARLYSPDMTSRTYAHLADHTRTLLTAHYSVFVDATFLQHWQRQLFIQLAQAQRIPITIIALAAPLAVLRTRIKTRLMTGQDASDADCTTLTHQHHINEPLTAAELFHTQFLITEHPTQIATFVRHILRTQ